MSPEVETLDQLLSGPLLLEVIRGLYPDHQRFRRGVSALLQTEGVLLLTPGGDEVPKWRWDEVLAEAETSVANEKTSHRLSITEAGVRRIGG